MTSSKNIEKYIAELYEGKPFIVPNGGDIQKVEITYRNWLWIEAFLRTSLESIHKEAMEDGKKIGRGENNELANKYARVIQAVYDGVPIEKAEREQRHL